MNRNDYRRAFLMLRGQLPGWSGHARLERRTLTGSLYFTVSPPSESDNAGAFLAGHRGGDYYALSLGMLKRDRRGQASLAYAFDPRSLGGRPLEAYAWIGVTAIEGTDCRLALIGNVEGSHPCQLGALRDAVCEAFSPREAPAADLPFPEETLPESMEETVDTSTDNASVAPQPSAASPLRQEQASSVLSAGPIISAAVTASILPTEVDPNGVFPGTSSPTVVDSDAASAPVSDPIASDQAGQDTVQGGRPEPHPVQSRPDPATESAPSSGAHCRVTLHTSLIPPAPAEVSEKASAPSAPSASGQIRPESVNTAQASFSPVRPESVNAVEASPDLAQPESVTAAQLLGIDATASWSAPLEPLRALFAARPARDIGLADGYTYVRAEMPAACGQDHCFIGLLARDGQVCRVRYAIPGTAQAEPPVGLERYAWQSAGDRGFWVLTADPLTGEPVQ